MKSLNDSELQALSTITSFFGIGSPQQITPIQSGIGNHNYIVHTDRGIYVIKFLITQKPEDIPNDIAIHDQLKKVHITAPYYVRNRDGLYLFQQNHLSAVVSEKIDGVAPQIATKELAFDIGKTLALFHCHVTHLPHIKKGWMHRDLGGTHSKTTEELFHQKLPA